MTNVHKSLMAMAIYENLSLNPLNLLLKSKNCRRRKCGGVEDWIVLANDFRNEKMLEIEILKTVKITTILIIKMDDYFLNKL